jgi:TRAP transporter TAXI family solute receptor
MTSALLAMVFGLFTITTVLTSYDSGQTPREALAARKTSVVIGTGSITGLYFPTGNLIARTVNNDVETHGIQIKAKSTKGSDFNINAIMTGSMALGIAQSDRVYEAVEGLGEWKRTGPQKDLRAMFSLHAESVVLVAADDAEIKTIQDLRGKRVDIGEPGSGSRQNAIHALENAGLDYTKDFTATGFRAPEVAGILRQGKIDAFFYTAGHPNINLLDATTSRRRVYFVPITDVNKLLMKYPYYIKAVVPKKFYPKATNESDVKTFGVKATFVTSAKVSDNVVYTVTKQVFEKIESYRTLHPAFAELTKDKMLECLAAPIHPGAKKYYDEAGLVPSCVVK